MRQIRISSGLLMVEDEPEEPDRPEIPDRPETPDRPRPPARPYFKIGDAEGRPGESVEVSVYGGSLKPVDGFDVCAGIAHNQFEVTGWTLGKYLSRYFARHGGEEAYYTAWKVETKGRPEPYWGLFLGFFSIEHETGVLPAVRIPPGTELFRVTYKVPDNLAPHVYTLYCADNWFYSSPGWPKRDVMYTYEPQGSKNEICISGKFTVKV